VFAYRPERVSEILKSLGTIRVLLFPLEIMFYFTSLNMISSLLSQTPYYVIWLATDQFNMACDWHTCIRHGVYIAVFGVSKENRGNNVLYSFWVLIQLAKYQVFKLTYCGNSGIISFVDHTLKTVHVVHKIKFPLQSTKN